MPPDLAGPQRRRGRALLTLGALIGLLLVGAELIVLPAPEDLPEEAIARVNGAPIWRVDHQRLTRAMDDELKLNHPPTKSALHARALDRLIDEELLVQRGLELDLPRRDPTLRASLASAVLDDLVARAESQAPEPSDADLQNLFSQNPHRFRRPPRLRVRSFAFTPRRASAPDPRGRATTAVEMLRRGEPVVELDDPAVVPVPNALLPLTKLSDYVGADAVRALADLEPGDVTDPIRDGASWRVLVLMERQEGRLLPFEEVREQVRAYHTRLLGERSVARFLEEARRGAAIQIDDGHNDR